MNRLENDLQFGRYVSYTRTNSICDHCGRTATLKAMRENPKDPKQTYLWLCVTCESRLSSGEWSGSKHPIIIDGSQFQPEAEKTNVVPSVWSGSDKLDKIMNELEETIKERTEREAFQKEILEYLKVTADMAENNDELAWRIWQVYGRLEDLWEE